MTGAGRTKAERVLRSALDLVVDALDTHRADMHEASDRPCSTCAKSARALATARVVIAAHDRACSRRTAP